MHLLARVDRYLEALAVTCPSVLRRRIWSEFLPPGELGAPATLNLLEHYSLEPLIALPPDAQTGAMAAALAKLASAGIPIGLWPLLADEQGYWPSEGNVREYRTRVEQSLAFARAAGVSVATIAVDLEPPLAMTHRVRSGTVRERGHLFIDALRERGGGNECGEARIQAVGQFAELAADLHGRGIATLAAVMPPLVMDLRARTTLWQDVLRTPVVDTQAGVRSRPVLWSVISPMAYSSMIAAHLPRGLRAHCHVLVYELGLALTSAARAGGSAGWRPSLSLGLLGTGKLGDEGTLATPRSLAADVASARASGVDDLALFSLEGLLARMEPESWLHAFTYTAAQAPVGLSARAVSSALRGAGLGAWAVARALG